VLARARMQQCGTPEALTSDFAQAPSSRAGSAPPESWLRMVAHFSAPSSSRVQLGVFIRILFGGVCTPRRAATRLTAAPQRTLATFRIRNMDRRWPPQRPRKGRQDRDTPLPAVVPQNLDRFVSAYFPPRLKTANSARRCFGPPSASGVRGSWGWRRSTIRRSNPTTIASAWRLRCTGSVTTRRSRCAACVDGAVLVGYARHVLWGGSSS